MSNVREFNFHLCVQTIIVLSFAAVSECIEGPVEIIRNLIQNNLVGLPVIHQTSEWEFDPEVALKRRELFQSANGFRGEKLIERIGLGIDGHHNERLAQQQARDDGLLGGTIHHIKYGLNTPDRV